MEKLLEQRRTAEELDKVYTCRTMFLINSLSVKYGFVHMAILVVIGCILCPLQLLKEHAPNVL